MAILAVRSLFSMEEIFGNKILPVDKTATRLPDMSKVDLLLEPGLEKERVKSAILDEAIGIVCEEA